MLKKKKIKLNLIVSKETARDIAASMMGGAAMPQVEIGVLVEGQGIYIGKYEPKDRDGASLGKIFNVFAAPTNLMDDSGSKLLLTFNDAVKKVGKLNSNGRVYKNDIELIESLKNDTYNGELIIPPREILHGKDIDSEIVQKDSILAYKEEGAMKGTIPLQDCGSFHPQWYWSLTEHREDPSCAYNVRLADGSDDWDRKDSSRLSCRLVRLVPVTAS